MAPSRYRHVLLAACHIRHGRRFPQIAGLEMPQHFPCTGVRSRKSAAVFAKENHSTRGGQYAAPGLRIPSLRNLPRDLACFKVDGAQELLPLFAWNIPYLTAVVRFACGPHGVGFRVDVALLKRHQVEEPGCRIVSVGKPVRRAVHRGTGLGALWSWIRIVVDSRTAIAANAFRP